MKIVGLNKLVSTFQFQALRGFFLSYCYPTIPKPLKDASRHF
jgi:hypothetical protein